MALPEGWTDDMTVHVDAPHGYQDVVRVVMSGLVRGDPPEAVGEAVVAEFGIREDERDLVLDRVQGGIVRALTGNPANRPNRQKDPLAWCSFEAVWASLPRARWWSKRRVPGGTWQAWYETVRERASRRTRG